MLNYSDIIDISLPLREGMPSCPNNPPFQRTGVQTEYSTIALLSMGSHTGTHVDAPAHAIAGAETVDVIGLHHFIGPCRVLDMTHSVEEITADELALEDIHAGERLLFKTQNSVRGFDTYRDDYIALSRDAAIYLAEIGPLMVGIDSWSIRGSKQKDNTVHAALLQKKIPIVEGLNLMAAEPGVASLIVLPLAIVGEDGAPARAVLLQ